MPCKQHHDRLNKNATWYIRSDWNNPKTFAIKSPIATSFHLCNILSPNYCLNKKRALY